MKTKNIIFILSLLNIFLITACQKDVVGATPPIQYGITASTIDLSNYPEPFVDIKNKKFNYIGVVGKDSSSTANLALTDIMIGLAAVEIDGQPMSNFDKFPSVLLDTEVKNPENYNLILVGTTYGNRLVAKYLGKKYPTPKEKSGLKEGEAKIILKRNRKNVALIVTGYTDEDARRAAKVLQDYKNYRDLLKGDIVSILTDDCKVKNLEGVDLSSDSGIAGLTNVNTLHLQSKNKNNQVLLTKTSIDGVVSTVYTKEAWIYYAGSFDAKCGDGGSKGPICVGVFYINRDRTNKKTLFAELKYNDADISIKC